MYHICIQVGIAKPVDIYDICGGEMVQTGLKWLHKRNITYKKSVTKMTLDSVFTNQVLFIRQHPKCFSIVHGLSSTNDCPWTLQESGIWKVGDQYVIVNK